MGKKITKFLNRLTEAELVFWFMPALMTLLLAGTLAQKEIGLFRAHEMFFSSFILWAGPVPLPGSITLLGILGLQLLFKFLLKSEWRWQKSGIILSHLGALILLFGGLMTNLTARETYMIIPEGSMTPYLYSYTERNLSIFIGQNRLHELDFENIENWGNQSLPFTIKTKFTCENCTIIEREPTEDQDLQSMAKFMQLEKIHEELEPEANISGLEFEITGTDQDGTYIAFDGMPQAIEITKDEKTYTLIFGKKQDTLPFMIGLKDFVKDEYAGTNIAQSYHSDVVVRDGETEWPVRIEMNKPLRYKGYTFFQSSFREGEALDMTVLAVVQNEGWLFPYIGTLVIGLGLLLHMVLAVRRS